MIQESRINFKMATLTDKDIEQMIAEELNALNDEDLLIDDYVEEVIDTFEDNSEDDPLGKSFNNYLSIVESYNKRAEDFIIQVEKNLTDRKEKSIDELVSEKLQEQLYDEKDSDLLTVRNKVLHELKVNDEEIEEYSNRENITNNDNTNELIEEIKDIESKANQEFEELKKMQYRIEAEQIMKEEIEKKSQMEFQNLMLQRKQEREKNILTDDGNFKSGEKELHLINNKIDDEILRLINRNMKEKLTKIDDELQKERDFLTKLQLEKEKNERELNNSAALKIQINYKGYRVRKKFEPQLRELREKRKQDELEKLRKEVESRRLKLKKKQESLRLQRLKETEEKERLKKEKFEKYEKQKADIKKSLNNMKLVAVENVENSSFSTTMKNNPPISLTPTTTSPLVRDHDAGLSETNNDKSGDKPKSNLENENLENRCFYDSNNKEELILDFDIDKSKQELLNLNKTDDIENCTTSIQTQVNKSIFYENTSESVVKLTSDDINSDPLKSFNNIQENKINKDTAHDIIRSSDQNDDNFQYTVNSIDHHDNNFKKDSVVSQHGILNCHCATKDTTSYDIFDLKSYDQENLKATASQLDSSSQNCFNLEHSNVAQNVDDVNIISQQSVHEQVQETCDLAKFPIELIEDKTLVQKSQECNKITPENSITESSVGSKNGSIEKTCGVNIFNKDSFDKLLNKIFKLYENWMTSDDIKRDDISSIIEKREKIISRHRKKYSLEDSVQVEKSSKYLNDQTFVEITEETKEMLASVKNSCRSLYIHDTNLENLDCQVLPQTIKEICVINTSLKSSNLSLTNLSILNLKRNCLADLTGFLYLPHLMSLDLSFNEITRINGIEHCKNLVYLNLDNNQLISVKCLQYLTNLSILSCQNNLLSNIDCLQYLHQLVYLSVRGNNFTKLPDFRYNPLLMELHMDDNNFSVLDFNECFLPNLKYLSLSRNSLNQLSNMESLCSVEILDISENLIVDLNVLENLNHCPSLKQLVYDGNPIYEVNSSRAVVEEVLAKKDYFHEAAQLNILLKGSFVFQEKMSQHLNEIKSANLDEKFSEHKEKDILDNSLKQINTLNDIQCLCELQLHQYRVGIKHMEDCDGTNIEEIVHTAHEQNEKPFSPNNEISDEKYLKTKNLCEDNSLDSNNGHCIYLDEMKKPIQSFDEKFELNDSENVVDTYNVESHANIDKIPAISKQSKDSSLRNEQLESDLFKNADKMKESENEVIETTQVKEDIESGPANVMTQYDNPVDECDKNSSDLESNESDFDYDAVVDTSEFDFDEESFEWRPEEKTNLRTNVPPVPNIVRISPFDRKMKTAWKPPSPSYSPSDVSIPSLDFSSTNLSENSLYDGEGRKSCMSSRKDALAEEWGLRNSDTMDLMIKRAKKLKTGNKKKTMDAKRRFELFKKHLNTTSPVKPSVRKPVERESYFQAVKSPEQLSYESQPTDYMTYSWVCNQTVIHDDNIKHNKLQYNSQHKTDSQCDSQTGKESNRVNLSNLVLPELDESVLSGRRVSLIQSEIHNPKPPEKSRSSSGPTRRKLMQKVTTKESPHSAPSRHPESPSQKSESPSRPHDMETKWKKYSYR